MSKTIGLVVVGQPFFNKNHRVIAACATPELAQAFINWVKNSPQAYTYEPSRWHVEPLEMFESEAEFEYGTVGEVL